MPPRHRRVIERCVAPVLTAALMAFGGVAPSAAAGAATQDPAAPPAVNGGGAGLLHTFQIPKPAGTAAENREPALASIPLRPPVSRSSLRTMFGVGYVQGADWGSEILAGGSVAGAQVQFNTLLTRGREGLLFDQASLSVSDADGGWRVEAGDIFSHLKGAALGGRVSWGVGRRRPAIAIYGPGRVSEDGLSVVSYRDQLVVRGRTLLDAEVASDRSYLLRSRIATSRLEVEGFFRQERGRISRRDSSIAGAVTLWRGVSVTAGLFNADDSRGGNQSRTMAVRFPVSKSIDLTVERASADAGGMSSTTSAAMAALSAGNLRLFHRFQYGAYDFLRGDVSSSIERQQNRSVSSYSRGARLNLALQIATERSESGTMSYWQELHTTLKLTRATTVRTVTAVPDVRNAERFQAYLRQELPRRFAVQADYGRVSAYQSFFEERDRPRFKVMLFKTVDITTPARGTRVTGRVHDHLGAGVAGVRVKLGPYTADTTVTGTFTFATVPRGEYELSIEPQLLPADIAWDGRSQRLVLRSGGDVRANLGVTPLNAIHGRVYEDRNGNNRLDAGEAVAGATVRAGASLTSTDADGAYAFYNLAPGAYVLQLQSVPAGLAVDLLSRSITLSGDAPATGQDFRVKRTDKPIVWEGSPK